MSNELGVSVSLIVVLSAGKPNPNKVILPVEGVIIPQLFSTVIFWPSTILYIIICLFAELVIDISPK